GPFSSCDLSSSVGAESGSTTSALLGMPPGNALTGAMIAAPPVIWRPAPAGPPGPFGRPGPPLDAPPGAPGPPAGPGGGGFEPFPAAERPPSFFSGCFELVVPRTPM